MGRTEEIMQELYGQKWYDVDATYIPTTKFQQDVYRLREYAVYPNVGCNIAYPMLGLVDEYGEVMDKYANLEVVEAVEEYMDVVWYLSQLCFEISCALDSPGFGLEEIEKAATDVLVVTDTKILDYVYLEEEILSRVSLLCGIVKKAIRDGKKKLSVNQDDILHIVFQLARDIFASAYKDGNKSPARLVNDLHKKLSGRQKRGVLHGDGDYR